MQIICKYRSPNHYAFFDTFGGKIGWLFSSVYKVSSKICVFAKKLQNW